MKVVNNLFWMDEPRPEWHDPEHPINQTPAEDVEPSGRVVRAGELFVTRRSRGGRSSGRAIA